MPCGSVLFNSFERCGGEPRSVLCFSQLSAAVTIARVSTSIATNFFFFQRTQKVFTKFNLPLISEWNLAAEFLTEEQSSCFSSQTSFIFKSSPGKHLVISVFLLRLRVLFSVVTPWCHVLHIGLRKTLVCKIKETYTCVFLWRRKNVKSPSFLVPQGCQHGGRLWGYNFD